MADKAKVEAIPELPKGPKWLEEVKLEAAYITEKRIREAKDERKHKEELDKLRAK